MAKILAPLYPANSKFIGEMSVLGADEFYLGISLSQLKNRLNRRPDIVGDIDCMSSHLNLEMNFEENDLLNNSIKQIRQLQKKVFLTLNEHYYSSNDIALINSKISAWCLLFDGVIVSDPFLMYLLKHKTSLTASVGTHVFNSAAIQFYIGMGVNSIVLPRATPKDLVVKYALMFPAINFEYLVFNDFCLFDDGHCRTLHAHPYHKMCESVIHGRPAESDTGKKTIFKLETLKKTFIANNSNKNNPIVFKYYGCRICNLYNLINKENIKLKIAGRGFKPEIINKNLQILSSLKTKVYYSETEFQKIAVEEYQNLYVEKCSINCKKDD